MFIDKGSPKDATASSNDTVILDVRFRLHWIPLEVVAHRFILQFHCGWLHRHNGLALDRVLSFGAQFICKPRDLRPKRQEFQPA